MHLEQARKRTSDGIIADSDNDACFVGYSGLRQRNRNVSIYIGKFRLRMTLKTARWIAKTLNEFCDKYEADEAREPSEAR